MKKLSQKQKVFAYLLDNIDKSLPAYEFVGERFIKCIDSWTLFSYKAPTRLTDIYQETGVLDRKMINGKSGAKYYTYQINLDAIKSKSGTLLEDYEVVLRLRRKNLGLRPKVQQIEEERKELSKQLSLMT